LGRGRITPLCFWLYLPLSLFPFPFPLYEVRFCNTIGTYSVHHSEWRRLAADYSSQGFVHFSPLTSDRFSFSPRTCFCILVPPSRATGLEPLFASEPPRILTSYLTALHLHLCPPPVFFSRHTPCRALFLTIRLCLEGGDLQRASQPSVRAG